MKRLVLVLLCACILGGCATSHMIKQDAKPTLAPKPNSALLVIFRDTYFGGGIVFWNYVDGKLIGETKGKTYFATEVAPGPHYVVVATENTGVAHFNFKPGKTYYLGQGIAMGVWRARTSGFYPMTAHEASDAMKSCTYYTYDPKSGGQDMDPAAYQRAIAEYEAGVKDNPESYKALLAYDGH